VPYLDRDGVRIYYEVHGDGPHTLLMSHGWGASSLMFAANVAALSEHHRVITWDLRGHGQTDYPSDSSLYSVPLAIGDMVGLLDSVGVERAIAAGHSLGGYLSQLFLLDHPARVEALVLIGTGPGFRKTEPREQWNAMAERFADRLEAEGLAGLDAGPEQRLDQHRDATGLANSARGILAQHDARVLEALPSIAVPTLIVVGTDDAAFVPAANYMAAKIPRAELVEITGAGHAPNVTHADEFDRHLLDFLGRI